MGKSGIGGNESEINKTEKQELKIKFKELALFVISGASVGLVASALSGSMKLYYVAIGAVVGVGYFSANQIED